jgi:hypothetical protein
MNLARILRKICGNLFTDKNVRFIRYCQTAIYAVVVGNRNEIHPELAQFRIELRWFRAAIGKIEPPEQPVFRTCTELRVNVKIAPAHSDF